MFHVNHMKIMGNAVIEVINQCNYNNLNFYSPGLNSYSSKNSYNGCCNNKHLRLGSFNNVTLKMTVVYNVFPSFLKCSIAV